MSTFILKQNSREIRKQLEDAGIHVCICASFPDNCWLDYSTEVANGVHGVGCYGEEVGTKSKEEELKRFTSEVKDPVWFYSLDCFIERILGFEEGLKCKTKEYG